MAARVTPFGVGQRWRAAEPGDKASFDFVILGPGLNYNGKPSSTHKRCRIEVNPKGLVGQQAGSRNHLHEGTYSHAHLKKYAQPVGLQANWAAMMRADLEYLGEQQVYPGHPFVIATCIFLVYPVATEAISKALGDSRIPGAGGNVSHAVHGIRDLQSHRDYARFVSSMDEAWARCDAVRETAPEKYQAGMDQAIRCSFLLRKFWQAWLPPL